MFLQRVVDLLAAKRQPAGEDEEVRAACTRELGSTCPYSCSCASASCAAADELPAVAEARRLGVSAETMWRWPWTSPSRSGSRSSNLDGRAGMEGGSASSGRRESTRSTAVG